MTRDYFSYWLLVRQNTCRNQIHDAATVLSALNTSYLATDAGLMFRFENNQINGEVDPESGVIEEDANIANTVSALAKIFHDYIFELDENNETDKSIATHSKWVGGDKIISQQRRTLDGDEYDRQTAEAIVEYLFAQGCGVAATLVKGKFL